MIKGLGIDLVEIERIKKIAARDNFVARILSANEQKLYEQFSSEARQLEFLAGRFAAKEAYGKALGTGIGAVDFKSIEILNDEQGKPYCANRQDTVHVSISHSDHYAVAIVIIE